MNKKHCVLYIACILSPYTILPGDMEFKNSIKDGNISHVASMLSSQQIEGHELALALNIAVYYGHPHVTQLLLEHGAPCNYHHKMLDGPPLHIALREGHVSTARTLLDNGAHTNAQTRSSSRAAPLHIACLRKNTDAVHLLMQYGADPEIRNTRSNQTTPTQNPSRQLVESTAMQMLVTYNNRFAYAKSSHNQKRTDIISLLIAYQASTCALHDIQFAPHREQQRNTELLHAQNGVISAPQHITPLQLLRIYAGYKHNQKALAYIERKPLRKKHYSTLLSDCALIGNRELVRSLIQTYNIDEDCCISAFDRVSRLGSQAVAQWLTPKIHHKPAALSQYGWNAYAAAQQQQNMHEQKNNEYFTDCDIICKHDALPTKKHLINK